MTHTPVHPNPIKLALFAAPIAFLFLALAPADAEAGCDSGTGEGCTRYPSCPKNFKRGIGFSDTGETTLHCAGLPTVTPTCGTHANHDDWRWRSQLGKCSRTRPSGDETYSTENIQCGRGYRYSSTSKTCERFKDDWAKIKLALVPDKVAGTVNGCGNVGACRKTVACSGSFEVETIDGEVSYRCKKDPADSRVEPTCSTLSGHSDWTWGSVKKVCFRKKPNGDRVESSANIQCPSRHEYRSASGKCVGTGSITYGVPTLKN